MHISVQGDASPPWGGRSSATWVGAGRVATALSYRVRPRLRIELSLGLLLLVPQPAVEVANRWYSFDDPSLLSCLAVSLDL
jgi:hypothetical protein